MSVITLSATATISLTLGYVFAVYTFNRSHATAIADADIDDGRDGDNADQSVDNAASSDPSNATLAATTAPPQQTQIYSSSFLKSISPLFTESMGCENMGPLLYSLIRFYKPRKMLEIGSGYTSVFMLAALRDNINELNNYATRMKAGTPQFPKYEWVVEPYLNKYHHGTLTCIDNLGHKSTTAGVLSAVAESLGLDDLLEFEEADAYEYASDVLVDSDNKLDMLWVDFGDGDKLDEFFELYWDCVDAMGGLILVHSTCTNTVSREWSSRIKEKSKKEGGDEVLGLFDIISFVEPHKQRQNSVTVIQRRGYVEEPYLEPVYTKYA
jgi:predicted O-methyltransferase YrrM